MNRSHRLLSIYTRFLQRKKLDKLELSTEFKVSERTIIRDIQEIRNYFYDNDEWIEKK
ncbi:HTH domain-containing protein [Staphylococcus xylosus]|nr:HTH domain-containing protein [Staphylococcus xylosus]RIM79268.1 HTH domain-containing protein [Staphylococcus xylosus]